MRIYNTMGRHVEEFTPRVAGEVSMYVCGPTVQAAPHVGHGRQAVAFDVIRRYLTWSGHRVRHVSNITDVEDKIIAAAAAEGVTTSAVAQRATAAFLEAYRRLRVLPPDVMPRATDFVPQMIALIERLIEGGHAYPANGDVYFAVRSFPEYGRLSGRDVEEMRSGTRIEPGELKHDPLDFALWKASKPGEPEWSSPWGPGRPGWHIECSAMAAEELGFGFDVHGGGLDLVFPHHENEIAQSEAAEGSAPFARYWLHNGMVTLRGEKMSKSEGNVVSLDELLERHRPEVLRLFYLRAQYRQPIEYAPDLLDDADAALDRLWSFRRRAGDPGETPPDEGTIAAFRQAMDDDFNTAAAIGALFDAVREGNRLLDAGEDAASIVAAYDVITGVLAIDEPAVDVSDLELSLAELATEFGVPGSDAESSISALIARRAEARHLRQFAVADGIRDGLAGLGIVLEDGADGTTWHRR
ncbi:MAG: cysteine--tRNA ligase [Acidimicrobiia bacterium]|nr:MAG: cysteine--tRNA ligase [Acidimicrobiia bacterium]